MSKPVIIDSFILIAYRKGSKTKLSLELMNDAANECFINETIVSEFLFYWLRVNGNKSPLLMHSSHDVKPMMINNHSCRLPESLSFHPNNEQIFSMLPNFMAACNLLPNDAIKLATCKTERIELLTEQE